MNWSSIVSLLLAAIGGRRTLTEATPLVDDGSAEIIADDMIWSLSASMIWME